jgi:cytochrome b subunit of formate dehydrogenase
VHSTYLCCFYPGSTHLNISIRHNPTSCSAPTLGVNKTFHPLLAPFILSSSISIATSYLYFQKDTWKLFHRIQLFKKIKKEREKRKESEKEK